MGRKRQCMKNYGAHVKNFQPYNRYFWKLPMGGAATKFSTPQKFRANCIRNENPETVASLLDFIFFAVEATRNAILVMCYARMDRCGLTQKIFSEMARHRYFLCLSHGLCPHNSHQLLTPAHMR